MGRYTDDPFEDLIDKALKEQEAKRQEDKERQRIYRQSICVHYSCQPTEWHWSGKPRVMVCDDCGATNSIYDDSNDIDYCIEHEDGEL